MKNLIFTFLCLLLIGSVYAQDRHGNPEPVSYQPITAGTFHFQHALKTQTSTWDSVRALSEINVSGQADAYPWLSSDGLRLYYSKGGSTGDSVIMVSRATTNDLFGNPVGLTVNFPSGTSISPWLTDDELHIYYTTDSAVSFGPRMLLHASRSTTSDTFGTPVRVTLNGLNTSFLAGPSFTQDLSELYLFVAVGQNNLKVLNMTGPDTYNLVDSLPLPTGATEATPGQLSKDDLKFYTSLADGTNPNQLGYFSRATTSDPFGNFSLLAGAINNTAMNVNQPSINGIGNMMAVVISAQDSWTANELYLAMCLDSITGQFEVVPAMEKFAVQAYPNPAKDQVTLDFKAWPDAHPTAMVLTDLMGKELQHYMLSPTDKSLKLDVSNLAPAVYLYRFQLPSGAEKIGKIMVTR